MDGWNKCNKNQDDEVQDWDMSNYNAIISQKFKKVGFSVFYILISASLWPATYKNFDISSFSAKIRDSSVSVVTQCPDRLQGLTCFPTIQHRQLCLRDSDRSVKLATHFHPAPSHNTWIHTSAPYTFSLCGAQLGTPTTLPMPCHYLGI